jgi:putative transposase
LAEHGVQQVLTGDLPDIATHEGWLYLAGLKDLYSGEIVGYAMRERMTPHLAMPALFRAVSLRRPPPAVIQHTGRDSQYCSHDYRALVAWTGMQASICTSATVEDLRLFGGKNNNKLLDQSITKYKVINVG